MKENRSTDQIPLYWLAFLLALGLRLYQLGAAPLSEVEAGWALQALGLAHAGASTLGAQPVYILITSQLFSILGDTNFMARFIPALAGSLVVWLPFYFRNWFTESPSLRRAGLVMAFGLAIDPGLVSLSRQAGSLMPAIAFSLLLLASLYNRRMVWAGVFAAMALLSGPAILQGLLILGVSWIVFRLVHHNPGTPQPEEGALEQPLAPISISQLKVSGIAFGLTLLVAGTLLLRAPQGLGGLAETIPAYLKTWYIPSGIPLLRLPVSLLVYQPLVLIIGIAGAVHGWIGTWQDDPSHELVTGLTLWALAAFLIPLLNVGRQVGDLAWALIPLWALAAIEIGRLSLTEGNRSIRLVAAGLASLLFLFTVIGWFNLLSIGRFQVNVIVYWGIIIGAFLLGLIAVFLVAAGYSLQAARLGMVFFLLLGFSLQLSSTTWGMIIVRQNGAQELWSIPPTTGQADLLIQTLSDLSRWNTGLPDQIEAVVLSDSSSLHWVLRDFPNVRYQAALSKTESPPIVITLKGAEEPSLAQQYRGQDFFWHQSPGWQAALPLDFVNWLAFRQAPLAQDQVILWARSDIFPGGATGAAGNAVP